MKRSAAALLLALFSFALIAPVVFADSDSKLPPCCRKSGKHHCSMAKMVDLQDDSAGATIKSVQTKCPFFPNGTVVPPASKEARTSPALVFFAAIVSHPTAHEQTEAQYRVAFSRARHKRGPPSLQS